MCTGASVRIVGGLLNIRVISWNEFSASHQKHRPIFHFLGECVIPSWEACLYLWVCTPYLSGTTLARELVSLYCTGEHDEVDDFCRCEYSLRKLVPSTGVTSDRSQIYAQLLISRGPLSGRFACCFRCCRHARRTLVVDACRTDRWYREQVL